MLNVNTSLGKIKVLLAEDNEVNKLLAKSILHHWGLEAKTAHTGFEAIEMLQNEDFDVILMDIQMPEKNGIEATQEIRNLPDEKKKNIPIIALTANALKGEEKKYLAAGMNDYLTKPFKEKELYDVLIRVMNKTNTFGNRFDNIEVSEDLKLPSSDEKLYSMTLVHDLAQNNEEFIKSLVQIFLDTIPTNANEMLVACEQKNWDLTGKLAHKLKSTIDTMQIVTIKEDIRVIEANGKNPQNTIYIAQLVKKVNAVISIVTTQLKKEFAL